MAKNVNSVHTYASMSNLLCDNTYHIVLVFKVKSLTFKGPNKNCSRRHFNFLLSSFEENKA